MKKNKKEHWYKITIQECPVCAKGDIVRERVYGEKPKDPKLRYKHEINYDYCDVL